MPYLIGVDGCRLGWLTVSAFFVPNWPGDRPGEGPHGAASPGPNPLVAVQARILSDLEPWLASLEAGDPDLAALGRGAAPPPGPASSPGAPWLVAVDMPIGLSEAGPRRCDQEARRLLGHPRGSSVFPAPIRPMLQAQDYLEACAIGRATDGRALSRQAWNLLPRIRQLDELLQRRPPWRQRIGEAHPEVIFQLWAGQPLEQGKRLLAGRQQRSALIEARWPGVVAACTAQLPRGGWAPDDLLDALACLRAAERRASGLALELGGDRDGTDLAMAITC